MARVSVVLPVHNGERVLGEAIQSVLGQTFHDLELNRGNMDQRHSTHNDDWTCEATNSLVYRHFIFVVSCLLR